jgi:hypothetical protein
MRRLWVGSLAGAIVLAVATSCDPDQREAADTPTAPVLSRADVGHRLIEGRVPAGLGDHSVSGLIGSNGGSIQLAGHSVTVPAGVIGQPTVFTMTVPASGPVQVELTAVRSGAFGRDRNVGAAGFDGQTVTLTLSYAWATNAGDPTDLVILRMHRDGTAEPLPVTLDAAGMRVTADLDHFSRYALASN